MARPYYIVLALVATFFVVTQPVHGQSDRGVTSVTGENRTDTTTSSASPEVKPPVEVPSGWSLFLSKISQNINLLLTLDPVKDAQKRVGYAMENLTMAKAVLNSGETPELQTKAQKLIERSTKLLNDVKRNQQSWKNSSTEVLSLLDQYVAEHESTLKLTNRETKDEKLAEAQENNKRIVQDLTALKGQPDIRDVQDLAPDITSEIKYLTEEEFIKKIKADKDRDGIPDTEEATLGTSNTDFDTDGDGLSDKSEIETHGTDPKKPDTDGDGFWDGLEILKGYNPKGPGALN